MRRRPITKPSSLPRDRSASFFRALSRANEARGTGETRPRNQFAPRSLSNVPLTTFRRSSSTCRRRRGITRIARRTNDAHTSEIYAGEPTHSFIYSARSTDSRKHAEARILSRGAPFRARHVKRALGSYGVVRDERATLVRPERSWRLKSLFFAQLPLRFLRRNARLPARTPPRRMRMRGSLARFSSPFLSPSSSLFLSLSRSVSLDIIVPNVVILSRSWHSRVRHGTLRERIKTSSRVECRGIPHPFAAPRKRTIKRSICAVLTSVRVGRNCPRKCPSTLRQHRFNWSNATDLECSRLLAFARTARRRRTAVREKKERARGKRTSTNDEDTVDGGIDKETSGRERASCGPIH